MIKLSAVIITYNEERYIEVCLKSLVNVCDEIIVVDSFSTDNTKNICKQLNVRFIEHKFLGYVKQKNLALTYATHNYVVSLDGDESLSETLQNSIAALKNNWKFDGYYANRFNNFCGQWIKHSNWYPNKKLRVFDKRKAFWDGYKVHEKIAFYNKDSKVGHLKGDILHKTYQSYAEFNKQTEKFSTLTAEAYFEKGKNSNLLKIAFSPIWAFFRSYILKLGFLDGKNGFIICAETANITYLKYLKLYKLQKNKD